MRLAFYTYSYTDRLAEQHPVTRFPAGARWTTRALCGLKEINFGDAISIETFTDMKLETACDVGYETLATAMRKAGVRDAS